MLQALLKVFAITGGVLIFGFMSVFFIRWMGEQQRFQAPPHPWFQKADWNIWEPDTQTICSNQSLDRLRPQKDWIVAIPITKNDDDQWFIPCEKPIPVADFLKAQAHGDWLLQIAQTSTMGLDALVEALTPFDDKKKFAVKASSQKVSVYLRKHAPEWLFAADSSSLLKFKLFTSLWIETAMDFWPDFVILGSEDAKYWTSRSSAEMQRRMKHIVWNSEGGSTPPEGIPVHGVVERAHHSDDVVPSEPK